MTNEEFLLKILEKITNIENGLSILVNTFVICIGILVAIFVCYLIYRLLDNFISFWNVFIVLYIVLYQYTRKGRPFS